MRRSRDPMPQTIAVVLALADNRPAGPHQPVGRRDPARTRCGALMTTRRTGWIVGALAVALVLSIIAPGVVIVLAVPVAVVGSILARRRPRGHEDRDVAERLLAAAATLTGERTSPEGERVDWGAALRAELATITVPRERRRFAVGAAVALLGRSHSRRSLVVAVAFGGGLPGVSCAGLGDDGLGSAY